jgi:hypothetical protein
MGGLVVITIISLIYAYLQHTKLEACVIENEELQKRNDQYRSEFNEMQKLYDQAKIEMQVQQTICEEQLKALSK